MHPIAVKQVKEIILVSDDVHASRRFYRDVLGLAMPAAADRLNLASVGSQYLGVAQTGTMTHPGFIGRLHLGLEIAPADFDRAVDHLRRQGIDVTIRAQQPGTWTHRRASARTSSILTRTSSSSGRRDPPRLPIGRLLGRDSGGKPCA